MSWKFENSFQGKTWQAIVDHPWVYLALGVAIVIGIVFNSRWWGTLPFILAIFAFVIYGSFYVIKLILLPGEGTHWLVFRILLLLIMILSLGACSLLGKAYVKEKILPALKDTTSQESR